MKFRIREIMDAIDEDDLRRMHADLGRGGVYMKKLVSEKLKQLENTKQRFCTTCGQPLQDKYSTYTILFGPEDFKKKASFCEIDCLEYFLAGLRKITEPRGDIENEL